MGHKIGIAHWTDTAPEHLGQVWWFVSIDEAREHWLPVADNPVKYSYEAVKAAFEPNDKKMMVMRVARSWLRNVRAVFMEYEYQ